MGISVAQAPPDAGAESVIIDGALVLFAAEAGSGVVWFRVVGALDRARFPDYSFPLSHWGVTNSFFLAYFHPAKRSPP
jgi:hypothetical protein